MPGEMIDTAAEDSTAADRQKIEEMLSAANWDARLLAARAQREKVLAEKGKARQTPPEPEDRTASEDPASAEGPAAVTPPPVAAPPPRPTVRSAAPAKTAPPVLVAPVRHTVTPRRNNPAVFTTIAEKAMQFSGRKTLIVMLCCCAALGFGLSFGFGTAVAVSGQPDTAPDRTAMPQAQASDLAALNDAWPNLLPGGAGTVALSWPPTSAAPAPPPAADPSLPVFDITPDAHSDLAENGGVADLPAPPRVLHLYAPDSVTPASLDSHTARVDATGFEIANIHRVSMTISAPHVRYYATEDAAAANTLAEDLRVEVRDFSQSGHGAPGRIEVWLDGKSNNRTSRGRSQGNPIDELVRLGNRLIQKLQ